MPTGYTSEIIKGQSFNDFVLNCARAFGACISLRDSDPSEPIPEKFKVQMYHKNAHDEVRKKIEEFNRMSDYEIENLIESEYQQNIKQREENQKIANDQILKYKTMLEKVKKWKPPTKDHYELKIFMVEQIQKSIEFDDMREYYKNNIPVKLSVEQWKHEKIKSFKRDLDYHIKSWNEEVERVKERNNWIAELRKSLAE